MLAGQNKYKKHSKTTGYNLYNAKDSLVGGSRYSNIWQRAFDPLLQSVVTRDFLLFVFFRIRCWRNTLVKGAGWLSSRRNYSNRDQQNISLEIQTPIPMKLEHCVKCKQKTKYNDLQIPFNLYSIEYTTKTRYLMFKLINFIFIFLLQIFTHFEFDSSSTFQLSWDSMYVYHCVTSPFLLTTLKCLGTEDTNGWSFVGGIFSHSCLMYDFRPSTVRGVRCHILRFIMRHAFPMDCRSGLQADQSSTNTLLLRSHAVVTRTECVLLK